MRTGRCDKRPRPAFGHDRPGVDNRDAFLRVQAATAYPGACFLLHRHRLAGQRRLVDLQCSGLEKPGVRRHDVAGIELDKIACDELGRRDDKVASITDHPRGWRGQAAERPDSPLGAYLLDDSNRRVEDDNEADHDGVDHILQCHGHGGRAEQQQDHGITKLVGGS
jgi:hypothetical protein